MLVDIPSRLNSLMMMGQSLMLEVSTVQLSDLFTDRFDRGRFGRAHVSRPFRRWRDNHTDHDEMADASPPSKSQFPSDFHQLRRPSLLSEVCSEAPRAPRGGLRPACSIAGPEEHPSPSRSVVIDGSFNLPGCSGRRGDRVIIGSEIIICIRIERITTATDKTF
jgi:hypothetical protein